MKAITNILKSIGLGLLVFLFFYLAGSFCNASFNINNWGEGSKGVVAFFGLIVSVIVMFISYSLLFKEESQ